VVDAALRRGPRRAVGVGLGGSVADTLHSFVGVAGIGALLTRHAWAPPVLLVVSAVVLGSYGAHLLWRPVSPERRAPARLGGGFALGLSLTLFNPAALLAWIAVGALIGAPSAPAAFAVALGVGLGAFAWCAFLAAAAARAAAFYGVRSTTVSKILGAILLVLALLALGRAALHVSG
jgi:threonine/homoserine/homoserine lactone efflux protein